MSFFYEAMDGYMGGSKPNWPKSETRSKNPHKCVILPPFSS